MLKDAVSKPSLLRKYIYEYSLVALAGCVVFLFLALNDLNAYIRKEMQKDRQDMIRTIEQNTNAINQFNLIQRSNYLKSRYEKISFNPGSIDLSCCNAVCTAVRLLCYKTIRVQKKVCLCRCCIRVWYIYYAGAVLRHSVHWQSKASRLARSSL